MARFYSSTHEWVDIQEDGTALLGLSEHAVKELGDIVYVDPGEAGDELVAGEAFGDIESVKAASDLICPVDGKILEINEELLESPELLNEDPEGTWIIKIKNPGDTDRLMDEGEYLSTLE